MSSPQKINNDEETVTTAGTGSSSGSLESSEREIMVRFRLESNEIYPIPHIDEMEDELVRDIWYEKRDYDAIKNKLIPLIRQMMKGEEVEESNKSSVRGLEYRTRQGALRRQHNKLEGSSSVLAEQKRQLDENQVDDELLAEVYRSASSHCQDSAYALALKDEAFVQKDLDSMRKSKHIITPARTKSSGSKSKSRGINGLIKQVMRRRPVPDQISASSACLGAVA